MTHAPPADTPIGPTRSGPGAGRPTLFITDADVAALSDWRATVDALRTAYMGPLSPAMVPARVMARGDGIWLRGLCAVSPSGEYFGCKLIAASPKARRASYLISLFDQQTMELAALVDGNRITDIRTAATAIVAVDALCPNGPLRVGVIGSSSLARRMLEALAAVRTVASVRVFSPSQVNRERYAADFHASHGLAVEAADSPEAAVGSAQVVLCAARSPDESPVLQGAWLQPGMLVVSVGSTLPEQREVDAATMARATRIVSDMPDEVAHDTGDALAAAREGVDVAGKTVALANVLSGRAPSRMRDDEIVLYKSVGSALQDVVTAEMLLHRARAAHRYTEMPAGIVTITR